MEIRQKILDRKPHLVAKFAENLTNQEPASLRSTGSIWSGRVNDPIAPWIFKEATGNAIKLLRFTLKVELMATI